MKRRMILILTITVVLMLSGTAMAADDNNSRIQNLEDALANETAARIEKDTDLQQQVGGNSDNYSGTWSINGRDWGNCPDKVVPVIWSSTFELVQDEDSTVTFFFGDEIYIGTISGNAVLFHDRWENYPDPNNPGLVEISTNDTVFNFSGTTFWGNTYYVAEGGGACWSNQFYFGEQIPD